MRILDNRPGARRMFPLEGVGGPPCWPCLGLMIAMLVSSIALVNLLAG